MGTAKAEISAILCVQEACPEKELGLGTVHL